MDISALSKPAITWDTVASLRFMLVLGLFATLAYSVNFSTEVYSAKSATVPSVVATNTYEGYMDGELFMRNTDSTRDQAYQNCLLNASTNVGKSVRCTWGNAEIYAIGATDKRDKCNKVVDKGSKKGVEALSGQILLGTCDDLPPVITDVEFVDLLASHIKSGSEPNPLYLYGWAIQTLLDSYPGLLPSDFTSVETSFVPDAPADAITSDGFRTLARNLSARFGIPLESSVAVDAIMTNIETAP